MIPRKRHLAAVLRLLRQFPFVAILGTRQVGKTTLALDILRRTGSGERFDLEDPLSATVSPVRGPARTVNRQ